MSVGVLMLLLVNAIHNAIAIGSLEPALGMYAGTSDMVLSVRGGDLAG